MAPPTKLNSVPQGVIAAGAKSVSKAAAPLVSMVDMVKGAQSSVSSPLEKSSPVIGVKAYTAQTSSNSKLIESAPANAYLRVKLLLQTAGPVAYGFLQEIGPVASGKGILLIQGQEFVIDMPPATRLYLVSNALNRVGVSVGPIPYMQELLGAIRALGGR